MKIMRKKTILELRQTVENYMKFQVDGDKFSSEQEFEDEVRAMLINAGFIVQDKHNVNNANKIAEERHFGRIEDQIPDIAVECAEGLVFLELKFKNNDAMYEMDKLKVRDFVTNKKCAAAGVLFLDEGYRPGWSRCEKNPKYYYYWDLK